MKSIAVIPARYASTRFPGKPLAILGGKTVIERVYEQVKKVIDDVYVATDDDRIREAVEKIGADVDVVINVQGDEPFIHESQIRTVCDCFNDSTTQIATLGKPFGRTPEDIKAIENPNSPKIAVSKAGFALYFSRSVIPFCRGKERTEWPESFPYLKHIGLYAYRREVLREVTLLPLGELEKAESLEQLRWLENGYKIKVGLTDIETVGIDTPEDLVAARKYFAKQD